MMSRFVSDNTEREVSVYRGGASAGREVKCRIPRRSPTKVSRPALCSKPVIKSSHDANSTISRNSTAQSGRIPTRSRSQDERARCPTAAADRRRGRQNRPNSGLMQRLVETSPNRDKKIEYTKKIGQPDVVVRTENVQWQHEYEQLSSKTSSFSISLRLEHSQESVTATADGATLKVLQHALTDKKTDFDNLKFELTTKQKLLTEVFADMKATQLHIKSLGGNPASINLKSLEDAVLPNSTMPDKMEMVEKRNISESLARLPAGLLSCCQAAVNGQKEIVQWINSLLTSKDKGIRMQELSNKVTEFTNTYQDVASSMDESRVRFMNELSQAADVLRQGQDDHEDLRKEMECLRVQVAELQAQNGDMHMQLLAQEHPTYIRTDKNKVEELEKELKAEKCKRSLVRERLTRADTQVKSAALRVEELETQVEEARGEVRGLHTAVHQLQEQNLKIQMQADTENKKMIEFANEKKECIDQMHIEREKLLVEKHDLEHRLEEVESQYRKKVTHVENEVKKISAQLLDLVAQRNELAENCSKLKLELKAARERAAEIEEQYKQLLQERDELASQQTPSEVLEKHALEIKLLQTGIKDKEEMIDELKRNDQELKETLAKELKNKEQSIIDIKNDTNELITELRCKNDCIADLKKKLEDIEDNLQESELKVELYEHQLQSLKNNITYSHYESEEDKMDFFADLGDMINKQRSQLLEATRQNGELAEELQRKEEELKLREDTISAQQAALASSDEVVDMLSKKDLEQSNAINMLRNDLAIRVEAELNTNQQLSQKSEEINILLVNLEKRKQEIRQLEQIILTLEDHSSKMKVVKKSQQEKISALERKINENRERRNKVSLPAEYLDNLIATLEAELGNSDHDELQVCEESYGLIKNRKVGHLLGSRSRALNPMKGKRQCDVSDLDTTFNRGFKAVRRTSSSGLLENGLDCAYLSDDSTVSRSRDLNRYSIDNEEWISGRQNNINVYHTLRTDIALGRGGGGGGGGRCKAHSPVRTRQAQMPRADQMSLSAQAAQRRRH